MLGRYSSSPLDPTDLLCPLCHTETEDLAHFICSCPALQKERDELQKHLAELMHAGPLGRSTVNQWQSGSPQERLRLILESVEVPVDKEEREARKSVQSDRDLVVERVEALSLPYFVKIWRKRAELLGGVPMLDRTGTKLVKSNLRDDGRCRFVYVAGAHARDLL